MDNGLILDVKTLILLYTVIHFTIAGAIIQGISKYQKSYLKIIAIGFVIEAIGSGFSIVQGIGPKIISVIGGNVLLILGNLIALKGLLLIIGKKFKNSLIVIVSIVQFVAFIYYTYVSEHIAIRTILFSAMLILISIVLVIGYLSKDAKNHITRRQIYTMIMVYIFVALFSVMRIYNAIFLDESNLSTSYMNLLSALIVVAIVATVVRGFLVHQIVAYSLEKELEILSEIDPLTKCLNYRSMVKVLDGEQKRIDRVGGKATIALIDLDDFKNVNDNFGHTVGNEVLYTFAKIAKESVREIDSVCRFGGEEFLIMMVESDAEESKTVLTRIMAHIRDYEWGYDSLKVAFSAGILTINPRNSKENMEKLIANADKALYKAKRDGKGRCEIYDPNIPYE